MPRKAGKNQNDRDAPESKRIFRYWIEIHDLRSGVVRSLPLTSVVKIPLISQKSEVQKRREEILQLKDGPDTLEAKTLDGLASELRQRYPDETYERTLHYERDLEAERQRAEALDELARIIVRAAVDQRLKEEQG